MVMPQFKGPTIALLVVLISLMTYDAIRLTDDRRFNSALDTKTTVWADEPDDARRQFANAYQLQQLNDFKKSVKAYASIAARPGSRLQLDIKYNLAACGPGHTPVDFLQHARQCLVVITDLNWRKHDERSVFREDTEAGFRSAGQFGQRRIDRDFRKIKPR